MPRASRGHHLHHRLPRPGATARAATLGTDSGAVALALVGTVHHLLLTGDVTDPEAVVTRLVRALVTQGTPGPDPVSPAAR
ncbi:hypothetical protein NKG94_49115 [Micromonospora sp. M12]